MQANLLKIIVEDIAGKPATEIVKSLMGKKDVNEFLIAKKLKLTINQTRNILYKLSDSGLVSFTRKKDKRKGWYIYFWTLNSLKSMQLLERKLSESLGQLKNKLKSRKIKRFYLCGTCDIEVGEETALLNQFTCQECGQVYTLAESSKVIKEIENKVIRFEKQLSVIRGEREKLSEEDRKKVMRKESKEKRNKMLERKKKREERKKAAEKEARKAGKKTGKKVKKKAKPKKKKPVKKKGKKK